MLLASHSIYEMLCSSLCVGTDNRLICKMAILVFLSSFLAYLEIETQYEE